MTSERHHSSIQGANYHPGQALWLTQQLPHIISAAKMTKKYTDKTLDSRQPKLLLQTQITSCTTVLCTVHTAGALFVA